MATAQPNPPTPHFLPLSALTGEVSQMQTHPNGVKVQHGASNSHGAHLGYVSGGDLLV